jgi:hypothetical protein
MQGQLTGPRHMPKQLPQRTMPCARGPLGCGPAHAWGAGGGPAASCARALTHLHATNVNRLLRWLAAFCSGEMPPKL